MQVQKLPIHLGTITIPATSSSQYDIDPTNSSGQIAHIIRMEFISLDPLDLSVSAELNGKIVYKKKIDSHFNSHYYDINTNNASGPFKIIITNPNTVIASMRISFKGENYS